MVTSRDITPPAGQRRDWSLELGRYGVLLASVVFGGVFWAINGGFSVVGLRNIATSFNDGGRLFWAMIEQWSFITPSAPGLPRTQPVLPWLGVVSASIVQFVLIFRKMRGLYIPRWLYITALALSIYDFATTYSGLASVSWLRGVGPIVLGILTLALSFCFEFVASMLLKEVIK